MKAMEWNVIINSNYHLDPLKLILLLNYNETTG